MLLHAQCGVINMSFGYKILERKLLYFAGQALFLICTYICNHSSQFTLLCCMLEYLACIKRDLRWAVVISLLCVQCEQGEMPGCSLATEVLHGRNGIAATEGWRCGVQPRTR